MPTEIAALMIKTSGNPSALRPSIHSFDLSRTNTRSNEMLDLVRTYHPDAMATSEEGGAMIAAADVPGLIIAWHEAGYDVDPEMITRAEEGHALIIHIE